MPLLALIVLLAQSAAPDWAARWDDLWKTRDQAASVKELQKILDEQLAKDPKSFDANLRQSRLYNWIADGTSGDQKAELGKKAWEFGDKARDARPDDVRGHYQSAVGVGLYSEGIGILTALSQGIEGKFKDRIQAALKIDKDHLDGAPQVVWGRYFFKLPWPKRDVGQSIDVLESALAGHPDNWRAKIYLADALDDDGKKAEAKRMVQDVLDAKGGKDVPEEGRLKELAKRWIADHQ